MPGSSPLVSPAQPHFQLLDVRQVASLLGCSTRTVYRLAQSELMPRPRKLGALVRWPRSEIEAWIIGGCRPVRATSSVHEVVRRPYAADLRP